MAPPSSGVPDGVRPPLPRPSRPTPAAGGPGRALPPSRAPGPPLRTNGHATSGAPTNGHANGYASWDDLVRAAPLPERDLDLPGGLVVRLRKLSRLAQHELNRRALTDGKEDSALGERLLLLYGLVIPAMPDEAAVETLQDTLEPTVLAQIVDGIMTFSRLGPAEVAADDAAFPATDAG